MGTPSAHDLGTEKASAHPDIQTGVDETKAEPLTSLPDPVADRLSLAIDRASEAGQWTVVERLAEQLERHQVRQLEARADNVARLPQARKKPGTS